MAIRKIEFRGKRIDNGEWVEGDLETGKLCGELNAAWIGETWYEMGSQYEPSGWDNCGYEVDPSTVGQYTGLTDKNGRKIFEGDILKIAWYAPRREPVYENHEVVYSKSGFFTKRNGNILGQVSNYISPNVNLRCEVIGNIHDNPELLEVDNATD